MRFIASAYLLGVAVLLGFAASLDDQNTATRRVGIITAIGIVLSLIALI